MFYSWCWIDLKPSSFILTFPFVYILGFFWLGVEQWGIEEIFVFPQHVWLGGWKVKELKTNLFGWEEKWEDKKSKLYVWEPKMCGLAWQLLGMLGNILGMLATSSASSACFLQGPRSPTSKNPPPPHTCCLISCEAKEVVYHQVSILLMWEPKMCRFAWQLLGMLSNVLGRPQHALQRPRHAFCKVLGVPHQRKTLLLAAL